MIFSGTDNAIHRVILAAEIIKHRVYDLHQINAIKTVRVRDLYEPLEKGLEQVTLQRTLTILEIKLTKIVGPLDKSNIGYQQPVPYEVVKEAKYLSEKAKQRRKQFKGKEEDDRNCNIVNIVKNP